MDQRIIVHLRFTFLVFFIVFFIATGARAEKLLVVGTESPRIFEVDQNGNFIGFGVEIIRTIARKNGDEVTFQIYPWVRAKWMVENGFAQILVGPYRSAARMETLSFSEHPFYRDKMILYALKDSKNQLWDRSTFSLREFKIGVINGWVYGDKFESVRPSLHVSPVASVRNGFRMLQLGRFDILACNSRCEDEFLKIIFPTQNFATFGLMMDFQDGYFAFCKSRECDSIRMQFDRSFYRLKVDGELEKLANGSGVMLP